MPSCCPARGRLLPHSLWSGHGGGGAVAAWPRVGLRGRGRTAPGPEAGSLADRQGRQAEDRDRSAREDGAVLPLGLYIWVKALTFIGIYDQNIALISSVPNEVRDGTRAGRAGCPRAGAGSGSCTPAEAAPSAPPSHARAPSAAPAHGARPPPPP